MEAFAVVGIGIGCLAAVGVVFSMCRSKIKVREEDRAFLEALRKHKGNPYPELTPPPVQPKPVQSPTPASRSRVLEQPIHPSRYDDTSALTNLAMVAMLLPDDDSPRRVTIDCTPARDSGYDGGGSSDSNDSSSGGSGGGSNSD